MSEKNIRSEGQLVSITRMSLWFIGITLGLYVLSAALVSTGKLSHSGEELFRTFESQTLVLAGVIWQFLKPFLQIILCFLVLDWILRKLNISPKLNLKEFNLRMSFPSVLLIIVVLAFVLAIFYGIEDTQGLKELALVVLGYYVGTQTDWVKLRKNSPAESTEEADAE